MPRWLTIAFLIISPLTMTVALIGLIMFGAAFRKSFGAHTAVRPEALAIAAVLWIIHAGFVAAPFLYMNDRRTLAMWLTIPVSIIATMLVGFVLLKQADASRNVASSAADLIMLVMVVGGIVVYWLPVGALTLGR